MLTEKQKALIRAICHDTFYVKQYALEVLNEDKSKKNEKFVKEMTEKLHELQIKLPANIEGKVYMYRPEEFNAKLYFHDGLGNTEWIDSIYKTIFSSRKAAEAFTEMGIKNPVTLLLYGKPGTGKTEFVRYAAHELGLPIFVLNFSQMIDSHLGETSKNINLIFNYIKNNECILFLDELDCIAGNRQTATGAEKELSRISITLMQEIDRLPNNVIVIAATNMPENIDSALLKRFSIVKIVSEPTEDDNLRFIDFYFDKTGAIKYVDKQENIDTLKKNPTIKNCKSQRELIQILNQYISQKIIDKIQGE